MITRANSGSYHINHQGREMIPHGTSLFPIAFYNDHLEHERVPWHWHDEMEAVFIATGETVFITDTHRRKLVQGQGFFINADVLHSADGIRGTDCVYHSMVFHPRLIGGGIDSIFWQNYVRPLVSSSLKTCIFDGSQPWHATALERIDTAWKEGALEEPGFEFRVRAALSEVIFLLVSHLPSGDHRAAGKTTRDGERIKQMLLFIQQHYPEEITAADIAKSASLSESECLRCFRSTIGLPPIQYLRRFRVQKAAELLTSTDRKIGDIAAECGFQDPAYFVRIFREIKQLTPGSYREAFRRDLPSSPSPGSVV